MRKTSIGFCNHFNFGLICCKFSLVGFFVAFLAASLFAGEGAFVPLNVHPAAPKIRVGIFTEEQKLFVLDGRDTLSLKASGDWVLIDSKASKKKSKKFVAKNSGFLSASKTQKFENDYPGTLWAVAKAGKLTLVNETSVEEYLRGVVPFEIGSLDSSRYEALKAQAVAARTYAYRHFGSREALGFDVFADTQDQVYNGIPKNSSLTDRAILETSGEVLLFEGAPIEAYYHSTCAGHTESPATWGKEPVAYLTARSDLDESGKPWCATSSYMSWERSFEAKALAKLFAENLKEAGVKKDLKFKKILNLAVEDTLAGGRIAVLSVTTDKGSFSVRGDKVRWLFKEGGKILPSSSFSVTRAGSSWKISGKGFGHGIGMCQMGARERARRGQSYREILEHYYSGAEIGRSVP